MFTSVTYLNIPLNVYIVNIPWYHFFMTDSYHHGNLRAELIAAGLRMLNRDGIASFSLRRLSKELGVSHAAAYRHFRSREELLRAIFVESSAMFRGALAASVPPDVSGEEALMRLGTGYVRFFISHPDILMLFTLMQGESGLLEEMLAGFGADESGCVEIGVHTDCSDIDRLSEHGAFGLFRAVASTVRDQDRFTALNEREILLGFWSKVHGMASLLVSQKNFIPAESLDQTIERVIRTPF